MKYLEEFLKGLSKKQKESYIAHLNKKEYIAFGSAVPKLTLIGDAIEKVYDNPNWEIVVAVSRLKRELEIKRVYHTLERGMWDIPHVTEALHMHFCDYAFKECDEFRRFCTAHESIVMRAELLRNCPTTYEVATEIVDMYADRLKETRLARKTRSNYGNYFVLDDVAKKYYDFCKSKLATKEDNNE